MSINNVEKFLGKIHAGGVCFGMVITLSDPTVSEVAGDIGFDFTWIDAEHAPHTIDGIKQHIMAVRGTDCAPLVRVPWNEHGIIKPILDLAPAGVIIPMVNTADAARAAVAACKYPPRGNRGCGVRRGNRYGMMPWAEYVARADREPLVILQIEHVEAVKNLDAILQVEGIDSICIGPTDLSGAMGKLNQHDDPEVVAVIDDVAARVRKAGIILGTAAGPSRRWRDRGIQWIAMSGDCGAIAGGGRSALKSSREIFAQ
ncbi:MAG: HpcH/HpaI aldolase family protein [Lentisphaeria bacterium]|jgi:2-keto-3-deoxy-L-rhamnonate aldolase RhmA